MHHRYLSLFPRAALFTWSLSGSLLPAAALADAFQDGKAAMEQGNYAEAYCQWKPLAHRGHAEAQYNLGWLYANGNGLKVDVRQAVTWWEMAARQGHHESQFALALALISGEGVDRDVQQAGTWFLHAARAGHEDAQDILRMLLRENEPVIQDMLPTLLAEPWLGEKSAIKVAKANVRAGPGTDRKLVGQLHQGDDVVILGRRQRWAQVASGTLPGVGWIFAPLLTETSQ